MGKYWRRRRRYYRRKKRLEEGLRYEKIEAPGNFRFNGAQADYLSWGGNPNVHVLTLDQIMRNSPTYARLTESVGQFRICGIGMKLIVDKIGSSAPAGLIAYYNGVDAIGPVAQFTWDELITCNDIFHFTGRETEVKTKYINLKGRTADGWYDWLDSPKGCFVIYSAGTADYQSGYGGYCIFTLYMMCRSSKL